MLIVLSTTGRLVYFMGFAKGTDEERRIYDPNSCHEEYLEFWKKSTLDKIGRFI